jgi:hypothetical protein
MSTHSSWIDIFFLWSYFLVFLWFFYKKFGPTITNYVHNNIKTKQQQFESIVNNLNNYKQQYENHSQQLKDLKKNILDLKTEQEHLNQNCQIKIKTLMFHWDKQNQQNKNFLKKHYTTKFFQKWLDGNEKIIIEELDKYDYNYDINWELPTPINEKKNIFEKIDEYWQ